MPVFETKMLIDAISYGTATVKTLKSIDDKVKLNEAIFGIQETLLSAQQMALDGQQEMAAIVEAKGELEKEIAALRAFEAEKVRYAMHETKAGGITYLIKEDARNGEPPHHICATCYEKSVKSILQSQGLNLFCIQCGSSAENQPRGAGFVAL